MTESVISNLSSTTIETTQTHIDVDSVIDRALYRIQQEPHHPPSIVDVGHLPFCPIPLPPSMRTMPELQLPELPDLPELPELPKLPELPQLPDLNCMANCDLINNTIATASDMADMAMDLPPNVLHTHSHMHSVTEYHGQSALETSPQDQSSDEGEQPRTRNRTWENCHGFCADCHICGDTLRDYEQYCTHLKLVHYDPDASMEWLTCDVCGKSNAHKSNFISHLASHTGRKPFKCRIRLKSGEYCPTEASTRQNLQTHILKVHKISVKHKTTIHIKQHDDEHHLSTPIKKKKHKSSKKRHKKKKKTKKRRLEDTDFNMDDDEAYDPEIDLYGLPRTSSQPDRLRAYSTRKKAKLAIRQLRTDTPPPPIPIDAQKSTPYGNPLEILIAAATFVEVNNLCAQQNLTLTQDDLRKAGKHWQEILDEKTLSNLLNVAAQIEDISTTDQIYD